MPKDYQTRIAERHLWITTPVDHEDVVLELIELVQDHHKYAAQVEQGCDEFDIKLGAQAMWQVAETTCKMHKYYYLQHLQQQQQQQQQLQQQHQQQQQE